MIKYLIAWKLRAQTYLGTTVELESPLTVEFTIERKNNSSSNTASIRVLNVDPTLRELLRKDFSDINAYRQIEFSAGYGGEFTTVFKGRINLCQSFRQGTEYITEFNCLDEGFLFTNTRYSQTWPAGTPKQVIILDVISKLAAQGVSVGSIGTISGSIQKETSFNDTLLGMITTLSGKRVNVDNNTVYVLNDDQTVLGEIQSINQSNGIVATPVMQQNFVMISLLFEPKLKVNQQLILDLSEAPSVSSLIGAATNALGPFGNKSLSGTYKITSVQHRGTISDVVAPGVTTTIGLLSLAKRISLDASFASGTLT